MDITHFSNEVVLSAKAMIYTQASHQSQDGIPTDAELDNPKVYAEVLSICIRRIKDIDAQETPNDAERDFWVDVFWYIAEINKMVKKY